MQDTKRQRPDTGVVDSDATSKETLADLEKHEKSSGSESEEAADDLQVPSPDGAENEVPNNSEDAGPM